MDEQQALEQIKRNTARHRRTVLLIVGGILLLALLVLLGLYFFLPEKQQDQKKEYTFYPVSNVNIFESGEYPEEDRIILYCDNEAGYGLKEQITSDSGEMEHFDSGIRFLEIYLKSIISADRETYRSLFADSYLQTHTLPDFTQQMLYNMCIYYCNTESAEDGFLRVTYRLDYMIRKNNGTFRRDVGSDAIRPEYVVLLVSADQSQIAIEQIYTR